MVQQGPRTLRNIIGAALKRLARRIDPSPTPSSSPDLQLKSDTPESELREAILKLNRRYERPTIGAAKSNARILTKLLDRLHAQDMKPPEKTPIPHGNLSPQDTPLPKIYDSPFARVTKLIIKEKYANEQGEMLRKDEIKELRAFLDSTDDIAEVLSIGNRYGVFKKSHGPQIRKIIENVITPTSNNYNRLHTLPHAIEAGLSVGEFTKTDAPYLEKVFHYTYNAKDYTVASAILMHGINYDVFNRENGRRIFEHLLDVSPRFGYSVVSQIASHGVYCGALDKRHERRLYELSKNATVDKNGPWPLRAAELLRLSHYLGSDNAKTTPFYLTAARIALEHNMPRELNGISEILRTTGVKVNKMPKVVKSFNRVLNSSAESKPGRTYVAGLRFAAEHNLMPLPAVKSKLLNLIESIKEDKEHTARSTQLFSAISALHELNFVDKAEYDKMLSDTRAMHDNPTARNEFYNNTPTPEKVVTKREIAVRRRKNRALK